MLRYIYARELETCADLAHSMFLDRADQFKTRLGWDVQIDDAGEERDQYDALNPLYVMWEMPDGSHGGSMRFLPTTGPVMVNEVFDNLTGGNPISSPLIWECTRFCLSREAGGNVAGALTLAGLEIMRNLNIAHFAGGFDRRMVRIIAALALAPRSSGRQAQAGIKSALGCGNTMPRPITASPCAQEFPRRFRSFGLICLLGVPRPRRQCA